MLAPQGAVVQPRWTSASFLLYAGGIVVLAAAAEALGFLSQDYGDAAFAGWAALIFVLLAAIALTFHGAGRWIAAGVFAVSTVIAWGVFVGALEEWFGWFPHGSTPLHGFHVAVLLLALLVLLAALGALRVFRFPLLLVVVVAATWYFVVDFVSNGGNWSAVVTLFVGVAYFVLALSVDAGPARPYAFWLHVAAGVAAGGALLWFWGCVRSARGRGIRRLPPLRHGARRRCSASRPQPDGRRRRGRLGAGTHRSRQVDPARPLRRLSPAVRRVAERPRRPGGDRDGGASRAPAARLDRHRGPALPPGSPP